MFLGSFPRFLKTGFRFMVSRVLLCRNDVDHSCGKRRLKQDFILVSMFCGGTKLAFRVKWRFALVGWFACMAWRVMLAADWIGGVGT
jgi:hypothetical protein